MEGFVFQIESNFVEDCLALAIAEYWFSTQQNHPQRHILWNGDRKFGCMSHGCEWVIFGYVPDSIVEDATERLFKGGRDGNLQTCRRTMLRYIADLKAESRLFAHSCAA